MDRKTKIFSDTNTDYAYQSFSNFIENNPIKLEHITAFAKQNVTYIIITYFEK